MVLKSTFNWTVWTGPEACVTGSTRDPMPGQYLLAISSENRRICIRVCMGKSSKTGFRLCDRARFRQRPRPHDMTQPIRRENVDLTAAMLEELGWAAQET